MPETMPQPQEPTAREGFSSSYTIELLFDHSPRIDLDDLGSLDGFEPVPEKPGSGLVLRDPAQEWDPQSSPRWVLAPDVRPWSEHRYHDALEQSWSWPAAAESLGRCSSSWLLADRRATRLPYRERLERLQTFLLAVVGKSRPVALHWTATSQLVDPEGFQKASEIEGATTLYGAVNIRLYHLTEFDDGELLDEPEMIMDTLGLSALGLDDLQVHFRSLDPEDVGHFLYTAAHFLFERGPVIAGGDTMRGIDGRQWKCELEDALVDPGRVVIDFNPGEPFAAGNR
jgi:hypothetical protein